MGLILAVWPIRGSVSSYLIFAFVFRFKMPLEQALSADVFVFRPTTVPSRYGVSSCVDCCTKLVTPRTWNKLLRIGDVFPDSIQHL